MSLNIPTRKAEVLVRRMGSDTLPAINVKRYIAPAWSPEAIDAEFHCGKSRAEKVAEICYECMVEDFWRECAPAALSSAFPGRRGLTITGEGRSGGTLCVSGLGPVESWDGPEFMRWRKFCRLIRSEILYLETWDAGRELIEANEWAPREDSPDGERQKIRDDRSAERRALEAFFAIHGELDGREWSPDTLEAIAEHVRGAGLTIREAVT